MSAGNDAERLQSVSRRGELNHRVKDLFPTVLSISRQTLGHGQIDAAGVRSFEARLSSMARAHDLLTHGTWEQAELQADRFAVTGPSI
jgi:two-component sensor histidine kinase